MASQQSAEREGGGEGVKREGVQGSKAESSLGGPTQAEGSHGAGTPEGSLDPYEGRRIGPWHPPDYNRQRALADRLANPALRTARPNTSNSRHPQPLTASLTSSPYVRMSGPRASSGPPSSPRYNHLHSPRRQVSSSSTPRSYGSSSPRRQPPLFLTPVTSRKVTEDELDGIVERITKPTVSSRGGVDLKDKDFTYIPTPRLKTLPVVPGLERRYLGLQRVDSARLDQIIHRLTRVTSASQAKAAPNKNVYTDLSPGAHMVGQFSRAQTAL